MDYQTMHALANSDLSKAKQIAYGIKVDLMYMERD